MKLRSGKRTSLLYNMTLRKATGIILLFAYVLNPYGLLFADDTAVSEPSEDIIAVNDVQDDTEPADDAEVTDPVEDPDNAKPQEDPDLTAEDPADTTEIPDEPDATDAEPDAVPSGAADEPDATDAEPDAVPSGAADEPQIPDDSDVNGEPSDSVIEDTVLDSAGKTWKIEVRFGPECNIPSDAKLIVKEITSGNAYKDYCDLTEECLDDRTVDYIRLFDISIVKDGVEIEPAEGSSVKVTISLAQVSDHGVCVLHFPENEDAEVFDDVNVSKGEGTEVTFDTTAFSVFAVAGYTIEKIIEAGDGNTYKFILTYDDKAGFPEDASLEVTELKGADYEEYLEKTLKTVGGDKASYARIFDVSVVSSDGSRIQPASAVKVDVILEDAKGEAALEVVHFGSKPEQLDASRDGKVLTFTASGFSIYAIVEKDMTSPGWASITEPADVDDHLGEPLYISQVDGYFMTAGTYSTNNGQRTGIAKTKPASPGNVESAIVRQAVPYYFEKEGDVYYIYNLDTNGDRHYIKRTGTGTSTSNNQAGYQNRSLMFVDDRSDATAFVLGKNRNGIYMADKLTEGNGTSAFCVNMQSGAGGDGFAAYPGTTDINASFSLWYEDVTVDDPYEIDGQTYGLMYLNIATLGYALMADSSNNHTLAEIVIRTGSGNRTVYVDEDSEISMWTFNNVSANRYKLSTEESGSTVYLKIDSTGVSTTTDENEASVIKVVPGSGDDEHKIYLSCNGIYLSFDPSTGYVTSSSNPAALNLVERSTATLDETMVYSAKEVSVSDTVNVPNGAKVIVYTRIWNETTSSYDFYAIDHDGSLYPCYERGDSIMWVGDVLDSIQWDFTEYYWDDGTPNYYYELYNPYSDKYIAPQINGQILSSDKIGINLEGRREGEYFTEITAWDNSYYTYAALAAGDDSVEAASFAKAGVFYFALLNPVETSSELHPVETVDNADHGISMKIVDFKAVNASGGKESEVTQNYFGTKGNVKGLLSTNLEADGYPTIVYSGQVANNPGFKDLFTNAPEGRAIYNADNLFLKSTYEQSGYLEYNSCQNFATLLDEDGNVKDSFTVYQELGTTDFDGRNTLKHGQFFPLDNIKAGVFSYNNPMNIYSMHTVLNVPGGELDETDPRKYERLYTVGTAPAYYLGMEVSASFVQTSNGKDAWGHDLIFEFSGDDDFWFYVDGELVIDLGGVHSVESGSVNYATGEVVINNRHTTLRDIFIQNRMTRNPGMTRAEAEDQIDSEDIFVSNDGGQTYQFKDFSAHTTKIFYMERGAGASNLHIRFNLAAVAPGNILLSKQVTGEEAKKLDLDQIRYPYQIFYKMPGEEEKLLDNSHGIKVKYQNSVKQADFVETYTPSESSQSYSNVYLINPRYSAEVDLPDGIEYYRIVECGVNDAVYEPALINGKPATDVTHPDSSHSDYGSAHFTVDAVPSVVFNNEIKAGSVKMARITKELYDNEEALGPQITREEDGTTFSFRLSLSDGSSQNVNLTSRYGYYVADPDGKLCKWDPSSMGFTATAWDADDTTIDGLTDDEKDTVLFYTSNYGSISEIPAGYSIVVPGLPAGTVFRIEERDSEIPVGYSRIGYFGDTSTYDEISGKDNEGIINSGNTAQMTVKNMRGWGLTVKKEWSDNDYVKSYAPIYVALFDENDSMIDGSVHQIKYPDTSTYYRLDDPFDGIKVKEVTISNPSPSVDDDGSVSDPGTVTPVDLTTDVDVVTNDDVSKTVTYTVDYEQGTPKGDNGNVREDTVTNIREGALVLDLYKWDSDNALAGGKFVLKCEGSVVGEYTTDSKGKIAVLYGFEKNKDYELTQTEAPAGFRGLQEPLIFTVDSDGQVVLTDPNGSGWSTTAAGSNGILGYINVYNKPFELKIYKHDKDDDEMPLSGAHFALYRQLHSSIAGDSKSPDRMEGYEDLVTDRTGKADLSNASSVLKPGTYYLTETAAPDHHTALTEDILIRVSGNGVVTAEGPSGVTVVFEDKDEVFEFTLNVPNDNDGTSTLKITKSIEGNFGNRSKRFDLTVILTDGSDLPLANSPFDIKINDSEVAEVNTDNEGKLTFDIGNDDSICILGLASGTKFIVSEEPEGYSSEFFIDDVSKGEVTSVSGSVPHDKHVHIVNSFEGVIPTGVSNACGAMAVLITASIAGFAVMIAIIRRKRRYYL